MKDDHNFTSVKPSFPYWFCVCKNSIHFFSNRQRAAVSRQFQLEWREGEEKIYFLIVLQQFCSKAEKQSRGKAPCNWILCKFSQSEGFFFSTLRRLLNEMHFACLFKHYILNWFMMRPLYMVGYNLTLLRSICQG